jgi:hypothetical protein
MQFLTLREKYKLQMFENKLLKKIFETKRHEVQTRGYTGELIIRARHVVLAVKWRKLKDCTK